MARNGSGTYSLPATMATSGAVASATTVNTIMNDIAQALTDSINKDGTKAFASPQSMGGNRLTALGTATALTDAAQLSQVQKLTANKAVTVGGTVDAITLAFNPTITSLTAGMKIRWTSAGANTIAAATVNVDGLGAIVVKKNPGAAALSVGDLGASGTENEATYNGTNWVLTGSTNLNGLLASTTDILTGTNAALAATPDSIAALWEKGADVASAGSLSLGEGGFFNVTGTTTITAITFATDKAGRAAWVKFAGALTLTHNATSLILPGGANITTAANDCALFISEGSGNVRCLAYTKANGQPIAASGAQLLGTITTTSGSSQSLSGLVLTGYKFLRLVLNGVSNSSTGSTQINGNLLYGSSAASDAWSGIVDIDLATGIFVSSCANTAAVNTRCSASGLSTASTSVTVTTTAGTFDAGSITVYGIP